MNCPFSIHRINKNVTGSNTAEIKSSREDSINIKFCVKIRVFFQIINAKTFQSQSFLWLNLTYSTWLCTDYFLSDLHILASIDPKYDNRLFIEIQVKSMYKKTKYKLSACCVHQFVLNVRTKKNNLMYTTCAEPVIFL